MLAQSQSRRLRPSLKSMFLSLFLLSYHHLAVAVWWETDPLLERENTGGGGGFCGGRNEKKIAVVNQCEQTLGSGNCVDMADATYDYCERAGVNSESDCLEAGKRVPNAIGLEFHAFFGTCRILFDDARVDDLSTICPSEYSTIDDSHAGTGVVKDGNGSVPPNCYRCTPL